MFKRYIIFLFFYYDSNGGIEDFFSTTDNLEEEIDDVTDWLLKHEGGELQIVDTESGFIHKAMFQVLEEESREDIKLEFSKFIDLVKINGAETDTLDKIREENRR